MSYKHNYLELIFRTLESEATRGERESLQAWITEHTENKKLFAAIEKMWHLMRSQQPKSVPDIDAVWQKVSRKLSEAGGSAQTTSQKSKPSWSFFEFLATKAFYITTSVAALFLIMLYGSYRLSLPEYDELAMLSQLEKKNLYVEAKGELSAYLNGFAQGAQALLTARQTKWLIYPYYDPELVSLAITHLQEAFEQTEDPVSRNKYAFYMGKAYLMYEDTHEARQWFNRVLSSDAGAYMDEANKLLEGLNRLAPYSPVKMNDNQ